MDSIIFDLDGTIWDSINTVLLAWNSIVEENKQVEKKLTRKDFEGTMGLQMDDISSKLFPNLDLDTRTQIIKQCFEIEGEYIEEHGGVLYANVKDVLYNLSKKYKLFIVSNCQQGYIEGFFRYHQLENYFLDYEVPSRTGLTKGDNIKLIIERNNLSKPVYVGDTESDLNASRYAGIPFVYANYGFGNVGEYDQVIEKFDDLLDLF
ncbi:MULTISPECIES: HAD family hydrolase [Bacillus cereus group]|uniref:HAD family hydrolase n=1 Tax=Bacillus cereus group TaxID=86661 RepID=UPI000BF80907|nr:MULTISPECIES: HAD family hydrolase [Bacillus cereus group]PFA19845.1 HAD family hydrolase [Bacillus cereus]PGZ16076.1 HAD family hydrolase [Bacillus cereus]